MKTFEDMVGKQFKFYGVNCNCFKLDKLVFEAVEDEDDGYRSLLDEVKIVDKGSMVFTRRMLGKVQVVDADEGDFEGWHLVDVDNGHRWLRFGTDHCDDYYPWFCFEYQPREA